MNRFRKQTKENKPEVSTASLPDIVFMLLFFFMTVTVMKEVPLKVVNELPNANQVKKMQMKERAVYIHIGRPAGNYGGTLGPTARIQLNDKFAEVSDIGPFVMEQLAKMPEHLRSSAFVALKVDQGANMGLIQDVKEELRKVNLLKINYVTNEGDVLGDIP